MQFDPATQLFYDELERHLFKRIDDGLVTAMTAAAMSTKLRQVANGGVYLDTPTLANGLKAVKAERKWKHLHQIKVDALRDLIDELQGSPLLVAYDFEHDLDRLRKAFPKAVFACDYPAKRFVEMERDWNAGKIEVLFGHPQSIGHGLNLQGAGHHVAWHSLTWDFDLYDQFCRRVYRQGNSNKRVFIHRIIMLGTIDTIMVRALTSKEAGQQALFDGLVALKKERLRG